MIARIWTARTTHEKAAAYAEHLRSHVFAGLRALDGYEHAMLLTRDSGDDIEIEVITFWRSLEAVRAFSGPDVDAAVVTDTAAAMLTHYDRRARHFDVVLRDGA